MSNMRYVLAFREHYLCKTKQLYQAAAKTRLSEAGVNHYLASGREEGKYD